MRTLALLLVLAPLAVRGLAAQPPAPDPESYAVWGGALDALFGDDTTYSRLELWVDSLATSLDEPEPERLPLTRMLTHYHLSFEPLDALLAADSPAVRVDLTRLAARTRIRVARLMSRQAQGLREPPAGVGTLGLSRVSFFPGRRMALVAVFIGYCNRCGRGGLLLMTRRDDGTWGIFRTIRGSTA
ncbi:MAG: hypothetical protein ACJ8GN_15020 [Longimicrobiaceae bacterium]